MSMIPGLAAGVSIAAARRATAQAFRANGIESPNIDARLLVGHALGLDYTGLTVNSERKVTEEEVITIAALAERRLVHEPVARIIGRKEFWGLDFAVTPETLVPRPETETVIEAALAAIPDRSRPLRIADFGTGTGALLLALLTEFPNATGVATDISLPALAVARANAVHLGLSSRALFVCSDYGAALRAPFDLVVSNPPYITRADIALLDADVRDYDPHGALDGGPSGLDAYRPVAADARRILTPAGTLVVELGTGQAAAVAALMQEVGIVTEPPRADLSGHSRAVVGHPAQRG